MEYYVVVYQERGDNSSLILSDAGQPLTFGTENVAQDVVDELVDCIHDGKDSWPLNLLIDAYGGELPKIDVLWVERCEAIDRSLREV